MIEYYSAGIMDVALGIVTKKIVFIPVVTAALLALFKIVPNDKIQAVVKKSARFLASKINVAVGKKSWFKGLWNATIEPWLIDLLDNTVVTFMKEFTAELKSDNE